MRPIRDGGSARLVVLPLLAAFLAMPAVALGQGPEPWAPGRQGAKLTVQQSLKARPATTVDRRVVLRKRVQRFTRLARVERRQPRSQQRSRALKEFKGKLRQARNELKLYDARRAANRTSEAGVKFVAGYEGYVRVPAPDPVGFCTAGYGHLLRYSGCTREDIRRFTLSRDAALKLLRSDLAASERAVRDAVKINLTPGEFDALVSFTFNVGDGALRTSTLLRKLNAGDRCGAADEFLRWNRAGGQVLFGLTRRRQAERAMFLRGGCNLAKQRPNKATPDLAKLSDLRHAAPRGQKTDNRCVYVAQAFSRGDEGRDVRVIQNGLRRHGFGLKASGRFNVATKKSVQRFQRRIRHRPTGVVDARTRGKLDVTVCPPRLPKGADLRKTVAFDGTPTFAGLALMLGDARRSGWPGRLNSADRRRGVAERFGRLSQWRLWYCYVNRGPPGCPQPSNPANPVGRSTHELRSDGQAYAGPPGRELQWWQLGEDVSYPDTLLVVLRRLGYCAFRPYSSGSELQHINLCEKPLRVLRRRQLAA